MDRFVTHRGRIAVLDWTDVNTDLIIPARYLKRIEARAMDRCSLPTDATHPAPRHRSTTPRFTAPAQRTSP